MPQFMTLACHRSLRVPDPWRTLARMRPLLLALVLASVAACGSSEAEPDWQFGSADVDSALVGTWNGTWTVGAKTGSLQLVLSRTTPTASTKCGERTLSTKCIDATTIGLVGTLTSSDDAFKATPMTGTLWVSSLTLTYGDLNLRTTDGKTLAARFEPGKLVDGRITLAAGEATFSLAR